MNARAKSRNWRTVDEDEDGGKKMNKMMNLLCYNGGMDAAALKHDLAPHNTSCH
jgi:hypothetical protein